MRAVRRKGSEAEPAQAAAGAAAGTLATKVYDQLRREVITARFAPGEKLHIQSLAERFGVGLSPMREALTRLSREGLVRHEDQRGFAVAPIDLDHLEELTKTRCWFNEIGLRESIAHGNEAWEEGILLSFHRLSKLPRSYSVDGSMVVSAEWETAHRIFHSSLLSACGSRWLIDYCEQLFDAADFYRHVSRVAVLQRTRRSQDHERIMKAALARDTAAAVDLLNSHVRRTTELVRERLDSLR